MTVTAAQIEEYFEEVDEDLEDVEGSEYIIEKALSCCKELSLSAEDIAGKWDAYKFGKNSNQHDKEKRVVLNKEHFDQFIKSAKADMEKKKRKLSTPRGSLSHKSAKRTPVFDASSISTLSSSGGGLDYLNIKAPTTESPQRSLKNDTSFLTPSSDRSRGNWMSPSLEPSPPDQKFDSRENQGEVVASFNKDKVAEITAPPDGVKVASRVEVEVVKQWKGAYRYMYEDTEEKRENLSDRVESMVEQLAAANKAKHGVEETEDGATTKTLEFSPVGIPMQEAVCVAGRVCSGQAGKMKATSIVIEGSKSTSNGKVMKLRMGQLKQYACFPGQIIGLKGINNTGTGMVVEELMDPAVLPHSSVLLSDVRKHNKAINERPLSVFVAAGPFTPPDNLSFAPLHDLLARVRVVQPDALILMGPFLPRNHTEIANGNEKATFESMFEDIMTLVMEQVESLPTKVLVSLSTKDIISAPVIPSAPFKTSSHSAAAMKEITFLSNPATFKLNDITFGLTCEDTLFSLGQGEVAKGGGNRFARLASHIVTQQSYYPVFPPKEGDNIEFTHYDKLSLPVTPDILLLPSRFKYFASDIGHECVCVNPASLAKASAGGTYAAITIHSLKDEEMKEGNKDDMVTTHHIASRTRVDIARI